MPRKHSLTSIILVSAIIIGFISVHAYVTSHHTVGSPVAATPTTANSTVSETASAPCHMRDVLPDPACTPGVIDPAVTQATISTTICVSGYTKTVRPSASYTGKLKYQQMTAYGFTDSIHSHEEDHLISLELGGAPSDPANLWPEPHASPNPKDKVENYLHAAVCAGKISLADAQHRIATNWTTAEQLP